MVALFKHVSDMTLEDAEDGVIREHTPHIEKPAR